MLLLIVKRRWFDAYASGSKTIEYRLHRRPFVASVYRPGRPVRIAPGYVQTPTLFAVVERFELRTMRDCPAELRGIYPGLADATEIACIMLRVDR